MPRTSSGSANNAGVPVAGVPVAGGRVAAALLAAAFFIAATPCEGAVEKLETEIVIAPDGSFTEHRKLTVRLDDRFELDRWRAYVVALDDHRRLVSADAWRIESSGRRDKLSRRERDEAEYAGDGITYSSQHFLVFEPEELEVGSRLHFDVELAVEPYFPAGTLLLQPQDEAVEALRVEIRSKAGALRFSLPPALEKELDVVLSADGGRLTAAGSLPELFDPPPHAATRPSLLRFAWGEARDWPDIARWYDELESEVEHGGAAFDALVAQMEAAGETPAERLEAAVDIARRGIRYVAVEVGIGGYRPSPAAETAERGWGDCKDKSLLLVELLRRAGLEAYPALIRLDRGRRVDLDLPTPFDFNHLIVAVEAAESLELGEAAPVADGLLFIDPTQTTGSASYLHRGVQDQHALVVTGGEHAGRLVHLPTLPESEMVEVLTEVRPRDGKLSIDILMRYFGETGSYLTRSLDAANPTELESVIRRILLGFFPGAAIGALTWDGRRDGLPVFEVRSELELRTTELAALNLPVPDVFPSLADLDELEGEDEAAGVGTAGHAAALSPAAARYRTRLHLPDGHCPARERDDSASNAAGRFRHTVVMSESEADDTSKGKILEVTYEAVLEGAWHEADELPELRELAVAEHRASRRRLRFRCPGS